MAYPADTYAESVELTITASNQLHTILNGDSTTEVAVEDGSKIPSVRKAYTDSLFFLSPQPWTVGEYETVYNQLRAFVEPTGITTWWFSKPAAVSTPILMSTTPHEDSNWTLWNSTNNSVYETQKRLAAEAGLNMVGSFLLGGTVTNVGDVVFYETDGKYYGWDGTLPKTVSAGTVPDVGVGAWVDRTDVTLRGELNKSITQLSPTTKDVFDFLSDITARPIIFAVDHGVKNSSVLDSADALQFLIDKYPNHKIILPLQFAISHSLKYPSNCDISGQEMDHCVCHILEGFVSDFGSAFEPKDTSQSAVQYARFKNITFVDTTALPDGPGTTSTVNGIELLGTYMTRCTNLKGIQVNSIVHCLPPPVLGINQYTKRPILKNFDCSNVNYLFDFEPTLDGCFSCGDIFVSDIFTSGSMKYGARALDTDGFTWSGSTMFPRGQLELSGHYISVSVCHPFEAMASLGDADHSSECLVIKERNNGAPSQMINISVVSGFSGRLANSYSETVKTNKPGNGISLYNAQVFTINGVINDPSATGLYMKGCRNGTFNVSVRSANSQDVGNVHEPIGSYDTVLMVACESVIGTVSDSSNAKRYALYMDDNCVGCHVDLVSNAGTLPTTSNVRIPRNGQNSYTSLVKQVDGKYKRFSSHEGQKSVILENSNTTTPRCSLGRSGTIIRFDNTVVTTVTDIPDMTGYDEATLHIQDDGATRFAPIAQGGKFVFVDGSASVKLGRGTIIKVMRCPTTGNLVQI